MRKKEIMAILSLILVSGGFVVRDIHNYNTQSDAIKYECIKIDSPTDKIEKLSKECEEHKRQEYVNQKVEELRVEKERIRLEEERKRQEEEELRRQQEEQQRLQQKQANQVTNRGGDVPCGREIQIEVSWYCSCSKCCAGGTGITASGKPCTENLTIAMPPEFPFGTKILIDGIVYECMDTGSYIKTVGNVVRVDIYTKSHQIALEKGRYRTTGYILD